MASKRYAVLDDAGLVVNHIMIDDPFPANYWPGYGSYLVCLDGLPNLAGQSKVPVIDVPYDKLPQIGDKIALATGKVTKFVPQIVAAVNPDGTPMVDDQGNPVMVAMAPDARPDKASSKPTGIGRKP